MYLIMLMPYAVILAYMYKVYVHDPWAEEQEKIKEEEQEKYYKNLKTEILEELQDRFNEKLERKLLKKQVLNELQQKFKTKETKEQVLQELLQQPVVDNVVILNETNLIEDDCDDACDSNELLNVKILEDKSKVETTLRNRKKKKSWFWRNN